MTTAVQHQQQQDLLNLWTPTDTSAPASQTGQLIVTDGSGPESPMTESRSFPPDLTPTSTSTSGQSFGQQQLVTYDSRQVAAAPGTNDKAQGIKNPGALPKEILKMKKNRKRGQVAAGVVGGVVGLVALGPVGMVVGGVGGAVATKQIGKRRERKRLEKMSDAEIAKQMQNAPAVPVHASESTELL